MTVGDIAALIFASCVAIATIFVGVGYAVQHIIISRATARKIILEAEAKLLASAQDAKMIVDLNNRLTTLQGSRFGIGMGMTASSEVPAPQGIPRVPPRLLEKDKK